MDRVPGKHNRGSRCLALSYGCAGAWTEALPDNGGGGGDGGGGGGTGSQKPVATLGAFPASGDAPLTVDLDGSGCWSRTGGSLTYDWDFDGDNVFDKLGGAQTERHVFETAGNFTVKLRVTDSKGNTNSATTAVHVSEGAGPVSEDPVVSLGVYPTSGKTPLKVTLDASGSWAKDGKPLSYEYDYDGDGSYDLTSAEYSVDHTYNAAGTYHPKLRVTDSGGHSATATATLTVQSGSGGGGDDDVTPVIGLNAYPRSGKAPLKVTLDASASWAKDGKPLHYEYDVTGDGTYEITSDNYAEDYTYTIAGSYTPKLRVTDSLGHSATASARRSPSAPAAAGAATTRRKGRWPS